MSLTGEVLLLLSAFTMFIVRPRRKAGGVNPQTIITSHASAPGNADAPSPDSAQAPSPSSGPPEHRDISNDNFTDDMLEFEREVVGQPDK